MEAVPAQPGSYILHMKLPKAAHLAVGRLGDFDFPAGDYLYLGSAHGPGGLRGRLKHHLSVSSHLHWHIDYLRQKAAFSGVWYALEPGSLECVWSQELLRFPGAHIPAPSFGAADCRNGCPAHLVVFPEGVDLAIRVFPFLSSLRSPSFISDQNRVK